MFFYSLSRYDIVSHILKEVILISGTETESYSLTDTQAEEDDRYISLDKVGIRDFSLPLIVEDRERGQQHVTADVDVGVDLVPEQRGAHMSRFIELTEKYRESTFNIHSIPEFLRETCERLESNSAYASFDFTYFMEKESPLSDKKGMMDFHCGLGGINRDGRIQNWIRAEVPITTLCPCSKKNSNRGAHNQRALVITKTMISGQVWLEDLIEMIEAEGSSQLYSILKREDEAYVTDQAYDNPKFVEDVVRNLSRRITEHDRMGDFFIECVSFESIHNHNAYARVMEGDVWKEDYIDQPG